MSNILEKIIKERLLNYIIKYNILIDNQFGFRVGRSTANAVDCLVDSISNKLDNKYKCLTVSIDLKKAFDTLDNGILLKKLSNFGIRGISLDLLHSYLTNRKQYVSYHNVDSNLRRMNICVPQGSVLRPLLFLLYINDITRVMDENSCILFEDDTTLLFTDMDHCALENKANKYIGYIYSWLCFNKLTLHLDKTSYTTFGLYKPHTFNISLNDLPIKCTNEFKFLGVTIDNRLTWKPHITILASQLSRILAVIYKLRNKIDKQSLLLLYNSLFHSRLSNYKHTLNKIIILQNKVLICIYKLPLRSNIDFIYKRSYFKIM